MKPSAPSLARAAILLGVFSPPIHSQITVSGWSSGFAIPGADNDVLAITTYDDGTGNALYLGGAFTTIGGQAASRIAKWNGTGWSALGSGIGGPQPGVRAMTVYDPGIGTGLYVTGGFTTAGDAAARGIARWNGSYWYPLAGGINTGTGLALAVYDDGSGPALYLGGEFLWVSGVTVNRIAKWNGFTWSPLAGGIDGASADVEALAVWDDGSGAALYVGGSFTSVSGVSANRIARWKGGIWSALGTGMNDRVKALAVYGDGSGPALFAAGDFTTAGGVYVSHVAKWNGSSWSAQGPGVGSSTGAFVTVDSMAVYNPGAAYGGESLFVSGTFDRAGGLPANRIARWKNSNWWTLGEGLGGSAPALAVYNPGTGSRLFTGGSFHSAGGMTTRGLASWNGASWAEMGRGRGIEWRAQAMKVFDDGTGAGPTLFVAGEFPNVAGTSDVHYVGRWNGTTWAPLGGGMDTQVTTLAVYDDGSGAAIYAGGQFQVADGMPAAHIAKWNGVNWTPVGNGLNGGVAELVAFDDGTGMALYATGGFDHSGSQSLSNIARWNGSTWSSVGLGVSSSANALTVFDDGGGPALYVGGSFYFSGATKVIRVGKWTGSSWVCVGDGVNSDVYDLAVYDGGSGPELYAAGAFTGAGSIRTGPIAKWNGTTWSAVGGGVRRIGLLPQVRVLAVHDDGSGPALYAGGLFDVAGNMSAKNVARWDGTAWSSLGRGTDDLVTALGSYDAGLGTGADLYVSGNFARAGGRPSNCFGRWSRW
jgi:hypothetical protein